MKKLKALGAILLLASVIGVTAKTLTPAAYASSSVASVAGAAPVGVGSLLQVADNKGPWPDTVSAKQFGVFYDFEDVYDYVAGTNWTVTLVETGSGESDPVLSLTTAVKGGSLNLVGDTNDNDGSELDSKMEIFDLDAGDTLVFVANVTTGTDVTQADIGLGIGITDTDWLGDTAVMSDGIFFEKNDGDANLDLVFAKNVSAVADYTRKDAIATLAASTNYKLCFVVQVDPNDATVAFVRAYVNDAIVWQGQVTTDICDDEGMCVKLGLQQGEATNLKTLQVNSIGAAMSY